MKHYHAHVATIDQESFVAILKPSKLGKNRLAGIDFNKTRIKEVATVLLALSMKPNGFTTKDLADGLSCKLNCEFPRRKASYDLKKFIGKGLVQRIHGSIKYVLTEKGIKIISVILCMLNHELPALSTIILSPLKEIKKNDYPVWTNFFFQFRKIAKKKENYSTSAW